MTTRNVILLVAVLALCACGGAEQQATPTGVDKQPWEAFAANTITEYYGRNPELAVSVGLHEYDGQMSDFSLAAAEEYASWIDGVIATAASYDDLEGIEAFERDYMVNALRGELFWIRDSGFAINNPVAYAFALDFDVYIDREYAPLEERIRRRCIPCRRTSSYRCQPRTRKPRMRFSREWRATWKTRYRVFSRRSKTSNCSASLRP
jgi:hypothetical protein